MYEAGLKLSQFVLLDYNLIVISRRVNLLSKWALVFIEVKIPTNYNRTKEEAVI